MDCNISSLAWMVLKARSTTTYYPSAPTSVKQKKHQPNKCIFLYIGMQLVEFLIYNISGDIYGWYLISLSPLKTSIINIPKRYLQNLTWLSMERSGSLPPSSHRLCSASICTSPVLLSPPWQVRNTLRQTVPEPKLPGHPRSKVNHTGLRSRPVELMLPVFALCNSTWVLLPLQQGNL